MKAWILAIVLAVGLVWGFSQIALSADRLPQPVADQERVCNIYEFLTDILINTYNEQLVDARPTEEGGRYEVWKSKEIGSWTLLEVMPNGINTCVLGTGMVSPDTPDELMQRNAFSA